MRSGWNPTRRNRNIGTSEQGQGKNNRFAIPKSWPDDRVFWEVLKNPVAISQRVGNYELTFLVEPPRPDCFYPCTVDDVLRVLTQVPQDNLGGIELIIFRQPTRKQLQVSSVWGRFLYYATPTQYSGPAICLEAHDLTERFEWSHSLGPDSRRELERLEADGHRIEKGRRNYIIHRTPESVRNTVLFRTLLHEIGHYVDWLQSVILPSLATSDDAEETRLLQEYSAKPSKDKENFAHRYAEELGNSLRKTGKIPFPMQLKPESMLNYGLNPDWFKA